MKASTKLCTIVIFIVFLLIAPIAFASNGVNNFRAILSGEEEVPPVDTNARGLAKFQLNEDRTELKYRLIVANINDVTAAHLHWAPEGVNGAVVVPLFIGPLEGPTEGILAEGTITDADLTGPLSGAPLEDLIDLMENGEIYANVHTSQNLGGEIRGQIPSSVFALHANCWGQATAVFAQMGEMGEHASQQGNPRLGLANLARALYEAGTISEPTLAALGSFVADELGLSIEECE